MKWWWWWGRGLRLLFKAKKPLESDIQVGLEIGVAVFFHPFIFIHVKNGKLRLRDVKCYFRAQATSSQGEAIGFLLQCAGWSCQLDTNQSLLGR